MTWVDLVGYLASILVFATFCMRTMIPLRVAAIASNFCFIAYGFFGHLYPVLILHLVLLPMNAWRTLEMVRLVRRVESAAKGDLSVDWLKPFMSTARFSAGQAVFLQGEKADRLYYVISGELNVETIDHKLGAGDLFGEIAFFAPDHKRTQTVRCLTNAELLWISEQSLAQVCYQNPAISFYFLRLITNRLIGNAGRGAPVESIPAPA